MLKKTSKAIYSSVAIIAALLIPSAVSSQLSIADESTSLAASRPGENSQTSGLTEQLSSLRKADQAYVSNGCYQCHGYYGHGGLAGPRLSPATMPFETFESIVRQPYGVMPAYPRNLLSETTLRDIYAYLEIVPEPPTIDEVPLLKSN